MSVSASAIVSGIAETHRTDAKNIAKNVDAVSGKAFVGEPRSAAKSKFAASVLRHVGHVALYLALVVGIIAVWSFAGVRGLFQSYSMASPGQVVAAAVEYAANGDLWVNVVVSLLRVLEGFFYALLAATVLGVAAGVFKWFDTFIDLVVQILRPIPGIAWIPLAILWFGIGEGSKEFIIFIGAFFPIFLNTYDGIKGIDPKYFELARAYEIPKWRFIRQVVLPAALPQIMTGVRLGLSGAWICVVAAEMIGATAGVGFMLSDGRSMSRPDVVILAMLIIGIIGKLMDDVLRWTRGRVITWQ